MATVVTSTIGGTSPDYSTIAAWEAAIPSNLVSADEQHIGEMRAVTFNEGGLLIGAGPITTDATRNIILRSEDSMARTGSGFNGTAGSGAVLDPTGSAGADEQCVVCAAADFTVFEDFEVTASYSSGSTGADTRVVRVDGSDVVIRRLLVHDVTYRRGSGIFSSSSGNVSIVRCGVYNIGPGGSNADGIFMFTSLDGTAVSILYNTVQGCDDVGIHCAQNTGTGGTIDLIGNACFDNASGYFHGDFGAATFTAEFNVSSDATADDLGGTGNVINEPSSDCLTSTTGGSEDLRLKAGAGNACIDAGTDLGAATFDVHIDVDGYDLDVGGDSWDIGFDQEGLDSSDNGGGGATVTPAAAIARALAVSPSAVLGSIALTPAIAASAAGAGSPIAVLGSLAATPAAAIARALAEDPSVTLGSISLTPGAAITNAVAVDPTATLGSVSVAAAAAVARALATDPNVSLGSLIILPGAAVARARGTDPDASLGSLVVVPAAALVRALAADPTTTLGSISTSPGAAVARALAVDPNVDAGGSIAVTPAAAVARALSIDPSLVLGSITVTPSAATVRATGIDPRAVLGAVAIVPGAAIARAVGVDPVSAQSSIAIVPAVAAARALATDPGAQFGSITVAPAAAVARALGIDPVIFAAALDLDPPYGLSVTDPVRAVLVTDTARVLQLTDPARTAEVD